MRGSLLVQDPGQLAVGCPSSLQLRVLLLQPRQQLGVRLFQTGELALKLFLIGGVTEARLRPRLPAHQLGRPALQALGLADEPGVVGVCVGEPGSRADTSSGPGYSTCPARTVSKPLAASPPTINWRR
ncbi:hypothetical protein ACF1G5_37295 [Streptomyces coeruleorubidus]|uniref:hypothetical protein n=1 Tax=Streptomyces coeruleorubidus TaxID=116188 RepID=UPI0036FA8F78